MKGEKDEDARAKTREKRFTDHFRANDDAIDERG